MWDEGLTANGAGVAGFGLEVVGFCACRVPGKSCKFFLAASLGPRV